MSGCMAARLKSLRHAMMNFEQRLEAYVIPTDDKHQSEYVSPCDERRSFICGFTGSAGTAIVTQEKAAMWTDGRYFLQAEQQMDKNWTLMKQSSPGTPSEGSWLCKMLPPKSLVGADPSLLSFNSWRTLSNELLAKDHKLIPVKENLVDCVWESKPPRKFNKVDHLPIKYTGKSWKEKIADVRKDMTEEDVGVMILTALDQIAWLFNLRGSDIPYNPVFYSYSIILMDSIYLFMDSCQLTDAAKESLHEKELSLTILPYNDVVETFQKVVNEHSDTKFWFCENASYELVSLVPQGHYILKPTPVAKRKTVKSEQELKGSQNAHIKEATALCEFFCWLSKELPEKSVTEMEASEKIEELRKLQEDYVGPSFGTISSSGPNGAIIHYQPTKDSNRKLSLKEMYLCDTGSQFLDGTTDVTRTYHFGKPTQYQKECYTLVLKAQIALASAKFPCGIVGNRLDSIARKVLWDVGFDYAHGTGHGSGSYLNVHEGPISIHSRPFPSDPGLQAGNILSIEPGYYENNNFGIRLENLAFTKKVEMKYKSDKEFLTFEQLTLVPYQFKLMVIPMLTSQEIDWLNHYHDMCREVIGLCLKNQSKFETLDWLVKQTEPIIKISSQ